jgi:hypothetical protein
MHSTRSPLEHSPDVSVLSSPILLWGIQIVLAVAFLGAGMFKLLASDQTLEDSSAFPALFLRGIAVCELLGAAGLILPGLLRLHPELSSLAAAGLGVIMAGATVTELTSGDPAIAWLPFVLGLLAAFVAWRRRPAPGTDTGGNERPWRVTSPLPR